MSQVLDVPILKEIVPTGFLFGGSYAVMSEPDSIWYEVSLAVAAKAVQDGLKKEYHSFQHVPQDVKLGLGRLGVDQKKMEDPNLFRLIDTCTQLTGLPIQPEPLPPEHQFRRLRTSSTTPLFWKSGRR